MPSWKDVKDQVSIAVSDPGALIATVSGALEEVAAESGTTLTSPQQQALEKFRSRAPLIIQDARSLTVSSPESKQAAALMRQDIRAAMDLLEAFKRPEINRAFKAHREALAELNALLAPWKTADEILKSSQDAYELQLRRERQEAARRIEEEMRRAREETLKKEMEEAERKEDVSQILEVVERRTTPLPSIPVIHTPVKVEGGSTRTTSSFNLLDLSKVSTTFILSCIQAEVEKKGECEWLMGWIKREVNLRGKGAEKTVGEGSIEYVEGVSTGVRRKK